MAGARSPSLGSAPPAGMRARVAAIWPPLLAALLILALWELVVWWFRLPAFVLPTPQQILAAAAENPQQVLHDTAATVAEALTGYVAGAVLGLGLAILFVSVRAIERVVMPIYVTVNSVPMIAYGPLAIIWLGTGPESKVALIIVAVSYTVLLNALAGFRSSDPEMIALLRSFGAGNRAILMKLRIPGAIPAIFSGLRVAVVHAMILAVVLEMLGANAGLGWSVFKSTQMMNFVDAWVAVAASVVVSLAIYFVVTFIGRRCIWW